MSTSPAFAELCARSCFSFLEGASHPEELVERAAELSLSALAIADRDGLYGAARAHGAAKKLGTRYVVGAEVTLELDLPGPPGPAPRLVLLCEDHAGYSSLCRLLTRAHADHDKGEAGLSLAEVAADHEGLFAIAPLDAAWLPRTGHLGALRDAFGEHAAVAAYRHLDAADAERVASAVAAEARFGLPAIATARPLVHAPTRKPLADVMHCIRHKTTLDQAGRALGPNTEAHLKSAAEMERRFRDHPAWLQRTLDIAERCRFDLGELRYAFPSADLLGPGETPDGALRRLVEVGCRERYPGGTPAAVRAQIEKELSLIAKLAVAPYFLSVQQIVQIARDKRILCQGRGSAANSAVCFVLGVTAVDPSRSSLLFERFLSAERAEPPDIDVDFEHERREEVIQAIYERYGRDRAAMVSEIISYRGKSALREVGKAFGLSLDQVGRLGTLVTHWQMREVSAKRLAEAGLDPNDPRLGHVLRLAGQLEGMPRHLSIHVGGFVLSAEPLARVAPIEPARMEGRTVIPWDKDDLDALGFFKVDVLALGMLTAVRKTLAMTHRPEDGPFDPIDALARLPAEDPAVYDAVCRADTVGVFQIESRAQMAMLPRLRPRCFYDLVVEVALVRPGPIQGGMVHPYLRRRQGKEAATPPHPCLASILDRTLGVPLFQEQVMQIAMVGAGYSAGEADQLRRDMAAWRKHGRLERHHDRLLRGFAARGIARDMAERVFKQVQGFGEYGFPESHAASFALLVYSSSWLKVHHPTAFACALLNSQPMGFYSPGSIVRDAQRHGVVVRPVCVVHSEWDSTLERDLSPGSTEPHLCDGALRLGLRQVRGMGEAAAEALVAARREQAFAGIEDLVRRTGLRKNDVEALAEAGALAALEPERREALWRARAPRAPGLFEKRSLEPERKVGLPPLRPVEQLVLDYGRTGMSLADHPMRHVRTALDGKHVRRAEELSRLRHGDRVVVAGLVLGRQQPMTASGITFITLEDETGHVNLVVRRDVWERDYLVARHSTMMLARGRLEREGEVIHVLVEDVERLALPEGEGLSVPSRDFH